MEIRPPKKSEFPQWLAMREALYPDGTREELAGELDWLCRDANWCILLAFDGNGRAIGLIEATLRRCAEGCTTSPVGYIEGWYVEPDARKKGAGRRLVEAAEVWAKAKGCTEMASDAEAGNEASISAHQKLGYRPGKTVVTFAKKL